MKRTVFVIELNNGKYTTQEIETNISNRMKITGVIVYQGKKGEEIFIERLKVTK